MKYLTWLFVFVIGIVVLAGCNYSLGALTNETSESGYDVVMLLDKESETVVTYFNESETAAISITLKSDDVFMMEIDGIQYDSDAIEDGYGRTLHILPLQKMVLSRAENYVTMKVTAERPVEVNAVHSVFSTLSFSFLFLILGGSLEVIWILVMLKALIEM